MRSWRIVTGLALALSASAQVPASAGATPPGTPGPIYFAHFDIPGAEIQRVPAAGGAAELIVPTGSGGSDPAISPDGRTLAFSREGDLWTVPATGGTPTRLTTTPLLAESQPAWSSQSTHLAYIGTSSGGADHRLEIININAPTQPELLVLEGVAVLADPSFAPGDGTVAYTRRLTGTSRVHTVDRATQTPVPAAPDGTANPDWSPDGTLLAYERIEPGNTYVEIGPPGGAAVRLTQPARTPVFSPAGDALAVTVSDGNQKVARLDRGADGSWGSADDARTILTSGSGYGETVPSWSAIGAPAGPPPGAPPAQGPPAVAAPDTRQYPAAIVFDAVVDGDPELYAYDLASRDVRQLTRNDRTDRDPDVSSPLAPRPQRIAFTRQDGATRGIWTMRTDGTDARPYPIGGALAFTEDPSWGPDGEAIVFTGKIAGEDRTSVWIVDRPSGLPRRLSRAPLQEFPRTARVQDRTPAFSPDGTRVAFQRVGADFVTRICVVRLDLPSESCTVSADEVRTNGCRPRVCPRGALDLTSLISRGPPSWMGREIVSTAGWDPPLEVADRQYLDFGLYADDEALGRSPFIAGEDQRFLHDGTTLVPLSTRDSAIYGTGTPDGARLAIVAQGRGGSNVNELAVSNTGFNPVGPGNRFFRGTPLIQEQDRFISMGPPAWQLQRTPVGAVASELGRFAGAARVALSGLRLSRGTLTAAIRNREAFAVTVDVRVSRRGRSPQGKICRGTRRTSILVLGGSERRIRIRQAPSRGGVACLRVRDRAGTTQSTRRVRFGP